MTCPIHHIPSPAGMGYDGISLLGVPSDCKSYQNTLTESLRRSIRRNRSMPRARIFPNRIVGSDAPHLRPASPDCADGPIRGLRAENTI